MPSQPSISVVIPSYNQARYLGEAIESVHAQTLQPHEIIVVNDCSTDNTREILARYSDVKAHHKPVNEGLGAARNTGISLAQHEWISFLDSDDVWLPHKLEKQVEALRTAPGAEIAFGLIEQFHSPELAPERKATLAGHGKVLSGVSGSVMLAHRNVFKRAGLFHNGFKLGEFIDWFARAQEAGIIHVGVPEIIARRRLHGENMSLTMKNRRQEYLGVLKTALDRRRAATKAC
ncbi:MAG: glycosyltransferase [Alphaproteobacteria bacterium]|nr:glycosyltransferase [Alphaproteobacteria bacterium]